MKKVLIITSGFSSFVSELVMCDQVAVVGILDCQPFSDLQSYAKGNNIPYQKLEKQDSQLIQWIQEQTPDVISIYKMPFLLKKEIFSLPKYGTLNLHPSLLPKYRGPNPWFWIYYNMEKESGVTIHLVDEGEDTGNVIAQTKFSISVGEPLKIAKRKAIEAGTKLMIEAIHTIKRLQSTPQPTVSPTMRARNVFNYNGLINWEKWNVERIWHLVNGFPEILQTNQSFVGLNKLLTPSYYSLENINFLPGEFFDIGNRYILGCVDGIINFLEIM